MLYVLPLKDAPYALFQHSPTFTEPVPATARAGSETVLILRGKEFTHIATGTVAKGHMTLSKIIRLPRPIQWLELPLIIPPRLRNHARRIFTTGGRLPPKTGQAIRAALLHLMPSMKQHLA